MASLDELRQERLKKIGRLREAGLDPYPVETGPRLSIAEALALFSGGKIKTKRPVSVAGRLFGWRRQGGVIFFDLRDGTGEIQAVAKRDELGVESFDLLAETIDRGDFLLARGLLFLTNRRTKSLAVRSWRPLAKSLRPIPTDWFGLKETEERYRRRYLDSLLNPATVERFVARSRIISELRSALEDADYLEVETPMLQTQAGGASARPFTTHHAALNRDYFLRISPELYLKKMVIGGFDRVYELSRNFRNEGLDATHQPEFTMLEFYAAYSCAAEQMAFVEKLMRRVTKKIFGKLNFDYQNQAINLKPAFARRSYLELLTEKAKLNDPLGVELGVLQDRAIQLGVKIVPGNNRAKILDAIYKRVCRPSLIQPTFLTDFPKDYLPLAKNIPEQPELVDAFQLVIGGLELVKAFSELNDPEEQTRRFDNQERGRAGGDDEAQPRDDDFIEALEHGLPPCGGVGLGIDRLVMLLTNAATIREVIFFPTLKPRSEA